jgi:hypothetical protein
MLRSDETRKEKVRFLLEDLRAVRSHLSSRATLRRLRFSANPALRMRRVNLSGSKILLGFLFVLAFMGLLLWALETFWLFSE